MVLILLVILTGVGVYAFKESALTLQLALAQHRQDDAESAADAAIACQLQHVRDTGTVAVVTSGLGVGRVIDHTQLPVANPGCSSASGAVQHHEFGTVKAVSLTHRCGQGLAEYVLGSDLRLFQAQRYVTTGIGYFDVPHSPQVVYQQAWVRVVRGDPSVLPEETSTQPQACFEGVSLQ